MSEMPPRRAILDRHTIPFSDRSEYELECGHTVQRRTNLTKRWVLCGLCAESHVEALAARNEALRRDAIQQMLDALQAPS